MSEPQRAASGRVPRSQELYRRALELIPGGTQLISRRPTRYANGVSPAFATRARGARFWDVEEGNKPAQARECCNSRTKVTRV